MKTLILTLTLAVGAVAARAELTPVELAKLTPAEQACVQNLQACFPNAKLTVNDTPERFATTRRYLHGAENIVFKGHDPLTETDFLVRPDGYDTKFVSSQEQVVINKALDASITALLNSVHPVSA